MEDIHDRNFGRNKEHKREKDDKDECRSNGVEISDEDRWEKIPDNTSSLDFRSSPRKFFKKDKKESPKENDKKKGTKRPHEESLAREESAIRHIYQCKGKEKGAESQELQECFWERGSHPPRIVVNFLPRWSGVSPGRVSRVVAYKADEDEDGQEHQEDGHNFRRSDLYFLLVFLGEVLDFDLFFFFITENYSIFPLFY